MRPFSRWMPPAEKHRTTLAGWLILAAFLGGLVAATFAWPIWVGGLLGAATVFTIVANVLLHFQLRRLAAERPGEDIGTFAWALDRSRQPFDPWVARATWDALQPYVTFCGGRAPLRPSDRFVEDLRIDPDDLWLDVVSEITDRTGYSLDHEGDDPLGRPVETVGDLVKFITLHPRRDTRTTRPV